MPKTKERKASSSSDSDSGPDDRTPAKKSKVVPKSSGDSKRKETTKASNDRNDDSDLSWDLGKSRSVKLTEFKNKWYVDIREFYMNDDGEKKPGRKGIMLTMEQWQKFKTLIPDIEEAIKKNI